jgi:hypothetical protein
MRLLCFLQKYAVCILCSVAIYGKVVYRSINTYALKHFGMVWRSLSLSISIIILRGPFEEQLGKLATNIKKFQKIIDA